MIGFLLSQTRVRPTRGRRARGLASTFGCEQLEPRLVLSGLDLTCGSAGKTNPQAWTLDDLNLKPIGENLTGSEIRGERQVVLLDFDGASNVTYDGPIPVEDLTIVPFSRENFGLEGYEKRTSCRADWLD